MHGDVEAFSQFLISLLDTPEKINLLTEVRYITSDYLTGSQCHIINVASSILVDPLSAHRISFTLIE